MMKQTVLEPLTLECDLPLFDVLAMSLSTLTTGGYLWTQLLVEFDS
jgi:hypothetical protein